MPNINTTQVCVCGFMHVLQVTTKYVKYDYLGLLCISSGIMRQCPVLALAAELPVQVTGVPLTHWPGTLPQ